MRALSKGCSLLLIWLAGVTISVGQTTASCTYQTFQYPGSSHTLANGINRYGTIVGTVDNLDSQGNIVEFGFVRFSNGSFQKVVAPGSLRTRLNRRNASGATVGQYLTSNGTHGLLLSGGTFTTIDHPGGNNTNLTGINQFGTIVGYYFNSAGHAVGFKRWSNGTFATIQFPGESDTFPSAISDTGVIVGWVGAGAPPGSPRGFVFANGKYIHVDDPNASAKATMLADVNAGGTIVGTGFNSANGGVNPHGFRIINGQFANLVVPGALSAFGDGINGNGVIVGTATFALNNTQGADRGYIARCQ